MVFVEMGRLCQYAFGMQCFLIDPDLAFNEREVFHINSWCLL